MIRVQVKNDKLKHEVTLELLDRKYSLNVDNKNGNCFFIWTDGSKKAELSHWTNDNPFLLITEDNFRWLINCLCVG